MSEFRRDGDKGKGATPNDSPSHTPKKVLAKLNSFKVGPFKSNSQSEVCVQIVSVIKSKAVDTGDVRYSINRLSFGRQKIFFSHLNSRFHFVICRNI